MAQTKVKLISDGVIVQGNLHASHGITTAHIGEGSNLYYTDARVGSYLSSNGYATQSNIVAAITDSAPSTLNTLNELAAALGDDANFSTTVTNNIATKMPLAGGTFTGDVTAGSKKFISTSSSSGDYIRLYAGSGTAQWDIYGNGENLRISENSGGGGHVDIDTMLNVDAGLTVTGNSTFSGTATYHKIQTFYDGDYTSGFKFSDYNGGIWYDAGADDLILNSGHANSQMIFNTGGSESVRIDSSGNVGINETSLTEKLEVNGAIVWKGALTTSKTSAGVLDRSGNDLRIRAYGATSGTGNLVFRTGGGGGSVDSEAMRIDSSGNVGIGTSSPATVLHIDQPSNDRAGGLYIERNGSSYGLSAFVNSGGYGVIGSNGSFTTDILTMNLNNGNVGIGTTSPSAKLEISGIRENQIRLTSYDTSAAVDEIIGGVEFYSSDTGNEGVKASISAIAANTEGSAYMTFSTGTNTERMRIESDGDVVLTEGNLTMSGATPFIVLSNTAETESGITLLDSADAAQSAKITYDAGTNKLNFYNNASNIRMVIDSSGNVGIGTTSPDSKLHIYTDTKDSTVFKIRNYLATANGSTYQNYSELKFISDANGNAPAGIRHYANLWHNVDSALAFFTNQHGGSYAEKMRIDGDGYLRMASGTGGIQFNGDTSTANALDDYEEGSWTPQIYYQNATDQSNATNVVQQGKYTKIGNFVFVQFRLDFSQSSSSPVNDNIGVKNLPFAGANNHYAAGGNVITSDASSNGYNFALPNAGSTIAVLNNSGNIGNYGDQFGSGSNKYIRGSFAYLAQ